MKQKRKEGRAVASNNNSETNMQWQHRKKRVGRKAHNTRADSLAEVITTHYTCEAAMASRLARVRAWQSAVQSKDDVR